MSREPRNYHEDADLFREALSYTQSETGFGARLVEKDYYCSIVLEDLLAVTSPQWVFKGGTCLSKVHSDFYRIDVSARKYETLTRQTLAQLRPVLRESDFAAFDLKRAFGIVAQIAAALR